MSPKGIPITHEVLGATLRKPSLLDKSSPVYAKGLTLILWQKLIATESMLYFLLAAFFTLIPVL